MLVVEPYQRKFLPKEFKVTTWEALEPYAKDLEDRKIGALDDFQKFLDDSDEFSRVLSEDFARRYIRMTANTADKEAEEAFHYAIEHINPKATALSDVVNNKMVSSPFVDQVKDNGFELAMRGIRTETELFRAENIPLHTQEEQVGAEYVKIIGAMTIDLDGETLTPQKAMDRLYWTDRAKREEAWKAIQGRRYQEKEKIDQIFDRLVDIRKEVAANAGFDNYRDYMFKAKKRYDYTPEDCYTFHDAVEKAVMPLVTELTAERAKDLGLEKLRPWDGMVDPMGREPLKAFENADDLIEKSLKLYRNMDPLFHDTLQLMKDKGQLDLASRPNKSPAAYMYPLSETKIPFIFSNVTQKVDDLVTLVHEVGHAVHEVSARGLRLSIYGTNPSETAELASMSMELITMDQWNIFFPKEEDLVRAKYDQIKQTLATLPGTIQVDAFQHEVYLKPELSAQDRHKIWAWQQKRFSTDLVDWEGFAEWHESNWQRVHHIFELPFYYIEYAMAQLGALQVWRNYKQDKKQALEMYKNALALGHTKSIPEIYETAGIKFDFSVGMLTELVEFVRKELKAVS